MTKLKKFKLEAWEFYQKWRAEKTFCPALDCEVRVSLLGWRHISGATGAKKRAFNDTYRRMKLLPYAKEIIEKSTTIQNVSNKGKKTFYALEAMVTVKENGDSLRKVRVILIEDKKKNKIFYSVMDKKQKNNHKKSGTPHA